MGVYVYSIKKASRRQVEFDGHKVEAAALTFHYKPCGWGFGKSDAPHEATLARIQKGWDGQTPDLIVVGEWKEGAAVQGAWPKGKAVWTDCNELPGQTVGHLRRLGRGWEIIKAG